MTSTVALRAIGIVVVLSVSVVARSQTSTDSNRSSQTLNADCSPADNRCNEKWYGRRISEGKTQSIVLRVTRSNGERSATVDLPDFGALDIPASQFSMDTRRIHFELVGDSSTAIFDGSIAEDSLHGSWKEGERSGSFELKRAPEAGKAVREQDVLFKNGDVRLSGTLLLPERQAPTPAIILVHGAGPETRSASRFLAEFFVKRGLAVLIYDKRGAGASSGDWRHSSFEDLAGDVIAAATFLKSRSEIDAARIGLMGTSQGGWIAPMAAVRMPDLAFVIVKSAAAVTPEQQELARVEKQMQRDGDSPADILEALALYRHAIAYARGSEGWESLAKDMLADAGKKWTMFDPGTPKDFWFFDQIRLTFGHDPIPVLQQVKAPLLVIFGGEDDDGPPLQNQLGRLMEGMRSGDKIAMVEIFPGAGHDLRVVPEKGEAWDFPRFAGGYLDSLASWVELRTK